MDTPLVSIIVALGKDSQGRHVIGSQNDLVWRISDDLKRFKSLTMGHPLIMGRKTFDSIGKPLPGRANIVVTAQADWAHEGVQTVHSLAEGIALAKTLDEKEIFVIGGAQIYVQALPYADKLYVTQIEDEKEGDVYFPTFKKEFTKETFREERVTPDGLKYTWIDLERE